MRHPLLDPRVAARATLAIELRMREAVAEALELLAQRLREEDRTPPRARRRRMR